VKAGAALAVLDVPELEAELQQASAAVESAEQEVNRAKAAYDEAHLMYSRLAEVLKQQPDLVAQQDIDEAHAKDETRKASWVAAQSAVREAIARRAKFRDMIEYSRITAPFAGVVSKRYADTGALMGAGTASASQSLVRLSQLDPLRLILPVPESKVPKIHAGDPVQVFVPSTGQTLSASVARLSGAVASETRTMHVEVDVPNPDLTLAPGMYASATLTLESRKQALSVPVEAVPNVKEGAASVLVLDKQNKIQERRIGIGIQTPTQIEVTSGLEEGDLVLLGGQGQVQPGQLAEPKLVSGGNPK
jgi:RND family efflux transporter MFP subunit